MPYQEEGEEEIKKRMRVVALRAVLILLALLFLPACSGSMAPVEAPSWGRTALATNDADLVGVMNLENLRADPLFGPLIERLARREDLAVLMHASQIDVVATINERGRPATWIAVVHGVDSPPSDRELGSKLGEPTKLASGATEYSTSHGAAVIVVPNAWILGEGAALDRMRANLPMAPARISIPSRALVASTMQGRATTPWRENVARPNEGLRDATVEVLGGSHLEFVARFHYVDNDAAKRASATARLLLAAAAARGDLATQLANTLVKIDFDVSGDVVTVRLVIDDDLRDVLQHYAERVR